MVNIDGKDYYHIEKDVSVIDAGEAMTLVVKSDVQTQSWEIDVTTYASSIINGSFNTVEKQLAKDILYYVRAAYDYAAETNSTEVIKKINTILNDDAVAPTIGEAVESTTQGV